MLSKETYMGMPTYQLGTAGIGAVVALAAAVADDAVVALAAAVALAAVALAAVALAVAAVALAVALAVAAVAEGVLDVALALALEWPKWKPAAFAQPAVAVAASATTASAEGSKPVA